MIDYKLNQFVFVFVPKIDRSGADSVRLPVQVIEIIVLPNKTNKYKLLSAYGILNICYYGEDLKPSDIQIECQAEKKLYTSLRYCI